MKKWILLALTLLAATAMAAAETYSYDAAGRLSAVDYGNGVKVTYSYDNAGNLLSQTVENTTAAAGVAANRRDKANATPRRSKKSVK